MSKHRLRLKLTLGALSIWAVASPPVLAKPIASEYTSFAGFRLGTVTLAQVEKRLGPATLVETGEAGEHHASVCYRTPEGSASFASGELGGPEHQLLGFELSKRAPEPACAPWPGRVPIPPMSIGRLHLGMTQADFVRRVPAALHWEHGTAHAMFTWQGKLGESAPRDRLDVVVSLEATFDNGTLVDLHVWKTETT